MKKFFYKKWAKVCTGILCIISFNIAVVSFLGIVIGESNGVYGYSKEEFRERMYDQICMNYSISAVVQYESDFNMGELHDTSFRYGVIQTDSLKGLDLNDRKIYEVCNFDQKVTEDMLYVHSFSMGESTEFYVGDSLFDRFYIYNGSYEYQETHTPIESCYYARDIERFYCLSEGKLYPVENYNYDGLYSLIPVSTSEGTITYVWEDEQEQVQFDGQTWYLSDIPILLRKDLSEIGTVVSDQGDDPAYEEYSIQGGYIVTYSPAISDTTPYYVLSYVKEPLAEKESFFSRNIYGKLERWGRQDYFVQAEALMNMMYAFRHVWFVLLIFFSILFVISFVGFMTGAGHHNTEEVTPDWLSRVPYDVFLILMMTIGMLPATIVVETGRNIGAAVAI